MNKLNILKAVKVVAGVAAVASAVAGTVMVVKTVRQYQEDSVNAINKAEAEGFETDKEANEVTEKLQMDGLKVVAASVGTVVVSGVFALVAHKASKMVDKIVKIELAASFASSNLAKSCILTKIESENLIPANIDMAAFINSAYENDEIRAINTELIIDTVKNKFLISNDAKDYLIKFTKDFANKVTSLNVK